MEIPQVNPMWNRDDRDLLIELKTQMASLHSDVKEMKDDLAGRLVAIEKNSATKSEVARISSDVNKLDAELRKECNDNATTITSIQLDNESFKSTVKAWGGAGLLALGFLEYLLNKFL